MIKLVSIVLTPAEAMAVMGALNVSSVLRHTIAPVTEDMLDLGKIERDLSNRVLLAIAATEGKSCPVTSHAAECTCMGDGITTEYR